MRTTKLRAVTALSAALAAAAGLAGCGGDDGGSASPGGGEYVDGATFTYAVATDPGALDPHASVTAALSQLSRFAYDRLVGADAETGEIVAQLASSWELEGTTATLEMTEGVTCSDGSEFTAETAANNLSYVADPANQSPFLGVYVPPGITATADGTTLTVELTAPAPFFFQGLADLPMVCQSGLDDRESLTDSTAGTGPFVLEEAVPGDTYTYAVRDGYSWGPDGASTDETGTPATIQVRVLANESTVANELIAGSVNAAAILGADADRLEEAGLFSTQTPAVIGEQWHNHTEGRVTSDPAVRLALTQAADYAELREVITSGKGEAPEQLAVLPPTGCQGGSTDALPAFDAAAAAESLDAAGWTVGDDGVREKDGQRLTLSFVYDSSLGAGGNAASEIAAEVWTELGAEVEPRSLPTGQMEELLFGTGDWDVAWLPINVGTPDQLVPFLSGPGVAEGGTNFAAIDNADYTASVETAMTKVGAEGCDDWMAAEEALFSAADVVPFASNVIPTFGHNTEFQLSGSIVPTSIRMLG